SLALARAVGTGEITAAAGGPNSRWGNPGDHANFQNLRTDSQANFEADMQRALQRGGGTCRIELGANVLFGLGGGDYGAHATSITGRTADGRWIVTDTNRGTSGAYTTGELMAAVDGN